MRAVVFDLDGTLLHFTRDYRDVLADAFRSVAGQVRETWLDAYDEAFYDLLGDCEPDPVERAFARTGCEASAAALREALLDAEIDMCEPPPGVHADLDRLAADHRLAVLTNGDPEWQRAKLDAHDLASHFDAVVVSCAVGEHKPAVAPFREVEGRLHADQYAMVGDADADVEGARRAGWTTHRYAGAGFGDLPESLDW